MGEYKFKQVDFDNPSVLFVIEDGLKSLIGEPLFYKPYFNTFGLKGDETVLDFGCECKSGDIRDLDISDSSFDVISAIHVVHDIAPAERQDIVKTLSQKLKAGGLFFIREPVKKSHGMPVEEIRTLLSDAGLNETSFCDRKHFGQCDLSGFIKQFVWVFANSILLKYNDYPK